VRRRNRKFAECSNYLKQVREVPGVAGTVGASLSPVLAGPLLAGTALASISFFISGSLKIVYDLLLYRSFQAVRAPEESE